MLMHTMHVLTIQAHCHRINRITTITLHAASNQILDTKLNLRYVEKVRHKSGKAIFTDSLWPSDRLAIFS
jgi:hypothetical protein